MPAAVIALLLSPFGLDGWAWALSAAGVETVLAIASEVSSWPGAVSLTPQWPLAAMLSLSLGGLWLCLMRSPLRVAGLVSIPIAAIFAGNAKPPDIFVAASGLNAGVFQPGEAQSLAVYTKRRDRFAVSVWQEAVGSDPLEVEPTSMRDIGACDPSGCVIETANATKAAFIMDPAALREDCARADLVVAFFPVSGADWRSCEATLIDRRSVWRRGAHAVWFNEDGDVRVTTVVESRGNRPWAGGSGD